LPIARALSPRSIRVLVMHEGKQQSFGPKDEVLRAVIRPSPAPLTVVAAGGSAAS
jgi:ABC-type protease/lipase transport system fused ATPase/permease subunit